MKKSDNIKKRRKRIRSKMQGTKIKPRLSVFRSNKHIYAQLIDDTKGSTLVSVISKNLDQKKTKKSKSKKAELVGLELAKKAKAKKINKAVFDRGSYQYHGRVKAVAEGARKGGLKF